MHYTFFWQPFYNFMPIHQLSFPVFRENVEPKETSPPRRIHLLPNNPGERKIYQQKLEKILQKKHKSLSKKTWMAEEDQKLIKLYEEGLGWEEISKQIVGSFPDTCYRRFQRLTKIEKKWPKHVDELIKELAERESISWIQISNQVKKISEKFRGYTPKMVRERYKNYLRPGLYRRPWTIDNDRELIQLVHQHQCNWASIVSNIEGRSELDTKNRYYGILEPMEKKALKQTSLLIRRQKQRNLST